MDPEPTAQQRSDLNNVLAAERTFLAWIRLGIALMGFGFVVARFGLFLQEFASLQHVPLGASSGDSLWFGTAFILAGVVALIVSAWTHDRFMSDLNRGGPLPPRRSTQAQVMAVVLALVGLAMAYYLVSIRISPSTHSSGREAPSMDAAASNGVVTLPSRHAVDETVDRLKTILHSKGITIFALIDHSGEAEKVGLHMLPTKLLIFGSPKAGTPLMLAAPSIALDLPLKILVWEADGGKAWISYNSPTYLQERHGLRADLVQNIAVVGALAEAAGQ